MKKIAAISVLLLSACASTSTAPPSYYRAKGENNQVAISGTISQTRGMFAKNNAVEILFDGQKVMAGEVSPEGEFAATWKGKPVAASCFAVTQQTWQGRLTTVKCVVTIDGERAANLVLDPLH